MAIIGLMGSMNVGKTAVLKMFVDYVEKKKIGNIKDGLDCKIEKKDFKGESEIEVKNGDGYNKTITPNKVVFIEAKSGANHTLFAPGGDRDRAVIRMGIITISRIARQIVGLFALDESLKDQFKLYDLIRYMPKKIHVCLNKYDLLEGTDEEKQATLKLLEEPAMVIEHNLLYSPEIEAQNRTMKNFLIFSLVVMRPLMYILILSVLDITKSSANEPIDSSPTIDLPYNLDLIFIIFLGISILIIFVTYWFVLPTVLKKYQDKGYDLSYFTFFLLIALNEVIVIFGLIIGILSWINTVHTDWLKFLILVGIGWIQMIHLYIWKIPKDFRQFSFKFSKNAFFIK